MFDQSQQSPIRDGAGPSWWKSLDDNDLILSVAGENMVFALDPNGLVRSWNERAHRIEGYRGEEIIGQHFSIFYPPERIADGHPDRALTEAARMGVHLDQGWRVRKDGSRFWAYAMTTAQRSDDGSLDGFVTVTRDDSELRTRHQRSTRRFTELFDLAPVGIGLFDEGERLFHANAALCHLLGYRLNELHGMTGAELLGEADREKGILSGSPCSEAPPGERVTRQRRLVRADGQPVICEVQGAMSMEDDGNRFWQVVFQDITEQHRFAEDMRYRATHDELTGLPSRAGINEHLEGLLDDNPTGGRAAVLYCDLDNFKRVNDSLGHRAGDELLIALARRLTTGLPNGCTPARLFGDEYLITCADVDAVGGLEQLTSCVSGLLSTVVPVRDQLVRTSASIGAAVAERSDITGEDLLRFADAAMFTAKDHSPGSVSIANQELISSLGRQMRLEGQLHDAIHRDQLALRFQPIVDAEGSVVLAEALVRWPHPERGLIGPEVILPVAEQGNLLLDLDRWVLRTAFREAASWHSESRHPVRVAVNLIGLLPDDSNFAHEVASIIEGSGLSPEQVVLEVVETSLGDLPARSREGMAALAERGVSFAVDDFGTGYSSLRRMKELPTEIIKIDRSFVSGAEHDPADFAVVRAIVEMGRGMANHCIAEGVESESQFHLLAALGVKAFQGFLFSEPLPPAEFRALLAEGSVRIASPE